MADKNADDPESQFPVPDQHERAPLDGDEGGGSFPIVGIGASAGGFEAYQLLLSNLPSDTGMGFVLIQHLDPHHESRMSELLARFTQMPVVEAAQGMAVEPDHVYVIPPNANLAIASGILQVTPRPEGRGLHLPIDYFFRTLAEDQKICAVGVVLSGTGSDGAQGLCEIKAVGGLTLAQSEGSAKYSGMPRSAAESGGADLVLAPAEIAHRLAVLRSHPYLARQQPAAAVTEPSADAQYRKILARVRAVSGVDFSLYRDSTIMRRIMRRMALHTQESLAEYVQRLDGDDQEVKALYHDLLINVTSFFRDHALFEALKQKVYPEIMKDKRPLAPVRVWVPGCSTGQEAYSIAMSLMEFFDDKPNRPPVQIFATDISDPAILEKARAGIYPDNIEGEVSAERLHRFFQKEDHVYRIEKSIRDMCVFARQNLTADPPFSHVDLVTCRNVLIYLDTPLQRRVLPIFHYALNLPGFLVLGNSETIGDHGELFELIDRANKIYAKKPAVGRPYLHYAAEEFRSGAHLTAPRSAGPSAVAADFHREADRVLLARFAPPGVLVNENLEILQFRGRTSAYLEAPPGEPTKNLLKMAREGMFLELRSAIEEARREDQTVRRHGLRVRANGGLRTVHLEVAPIRPPAVREVCFLILFEDAAKEDDAADAATPPVSLNKESDEREALALHRELNATKEYLQSLLEQQDAANEELRSANEEILSSNEELQSTNEELQTAKEELQSTNEELLTVNEQLHNRNLDLNKANNDLSNLFSSINIPVVMVGPDLRIRRFTPPARRAMNLLANDIGRPIGDLKTNIAIGDLDELIKDVIEQVQMREREVRDRDGRWHNLRIHPYRTADHKIDGAVILLIDIDQLKRAAETIRESEARFRTLADHAPVLIWVNGAAGCEFVNQAYMNFTGAAKEDELRGSGWSRYLHPDDRERFIGDFQAAIASREPFHSQFRFRRKDGAYRWMTSVAVPRFADDGEYRGHVGASFDITDITDIKQAEAVMAQRVNELREADRQKNEFLALLAHELRNPLAPIANAAQILKLIGSPDPRFHTSRDIIAREVEHMSRMLEDLLDLSRLTREQMALQRQRVKLADVLRDAVDTSRPHIDAKQHRLNVNIPSEDIWLDGDRVRLCQVFANLLINAAKYTGEGGEISLAAETQGSQAAVTVRDNGIGMSRELLGRIFEMFSQGESGGAEGGLGIGLTLVKSLVALHGGSVEARSDGAGKGSEFIVKLPIVASEAEVASGQWPVASPENSAIEPAKLATSDSDLTTRHSPPTTSAAPKRVLVVDDNPVQTMTLRMLLESDGHEVKTAFNGPAALALLNGFVPDFALIDIGLPRGMSGYDLARRMRAEPRLAKTVLIAQTGWGRDEDREQAKAAGFDHHLTKPINHELLARIMSEVSG